MTDFSIKTRHETKCERHNRAKHRKIQRKKHSNLNFNDDDSRLCVCVSVCICIYHTCVFNAAIQSVMRLVNAHRIEIRANDSDILLFLFRKVFTHHRPVTHLPMRLINVPNVYKSTYLSLDDSESPLLHITEINCSSK